MEYFVISAKFVPLKYYTLSSQLQHLASFSVGCSGRRILSPGQINIMRKWCIDMTITSFVHVRWYHWLTECWCGLYMHTLINPICYRLKSIQYFEPHLWHFLNIAKIWQKVLFSTISACIFNSTNVCFISPIAFMITFMQIQISKKCVKLL